MVSAIVMLVIGAVFLLPIVVISMAATIDALLSGCDDRVDVAICCTIVILLVVYRHSSLELNLPNTKPKERKQIMVYHADVLA